MISPIRSQKKKKEICCEMYVEIKLEDGEKLDWIEL